MLNESELIKWHNREVIRLEEMKENVTLDCAEVECYHTLSILRQILQVPSKGKNSFELLRE